MNKISLVLFFTCKHMDIVRYAGGHLSFLYFGDASTGKHHYYVHLTETEHTSDGRAARVARRT